MSFLQLEILFASTADALTLAVRILIESSGLRMSAHRVSPDASVVVYGHSLRSHQNILLIFAPNTDALERTLAQFDDVIRSCRSLFEGKTRDYGTSWRILRLPSLTDQLMIKAKRIRNLEEMDGRPQVDEGVEGEYIGLVNYSLMALMQLDLGEDQPVELPMEEALAAYDRLASEAKALMARKNHDYGEAWRDMRLSSITDLILTKLLRIKQIEDNQGRTEISEGLAGHYNDILIYAVFALIRLRESQMN